MRKLSWLGVAAVLIWTMPLFAMQAEGPAVIGNCVHPEMSKEPFSQAQGTETVPVILPADEIARMAPLLRAQFLHVLEDGVKAWRQWVEVLAANLANSETTRTVEGKPYRRQAVVFRTVQFCIPSGSTVVLLESIRVVDDSTPLVRRFEPTHSDAWEDGYVTYPNVNPTREMTDLMAAARGYEATLAAINMIKNR